MQYSLVENPHGFLSADPLPTQEKLEEHYRNIYFQSQNGSYQKDYDENELIYFENESRVAEYISKGFSSKDLHKLLDVGAGEGFFSRYFLANHWDVTCCDFSQHGIKSQNPELLKQHIQGDIIEILKQEVKHKNKYNLINLKNVLEHVLDPSGLLSSLRKLMTQDSLLRIVVPNDYSAFQNMLIDMDLTHNTWFCPPEHLHYFNFTSLASFIEAEGFSVYMTLADFPIELYLLNEHSNYSKEPKHGKAAHLARIAADRFLFEQGIEKYINYFKSSAKMGLGRQVIMYASNTN